MLCLVEHLAAAGSRLQHDIKLQPHGKGYSVGLRGEALLHDALKLWSFTANAALSAIASVRVVRIEGVAER